MRFQLVSLWLILLIASSTLALNCNYCVSFFFASQFPPWMCTGQSVQQFAFDAENYAIIVCLWCSVNYAINFFQFRMIAKTTRNAPRVIQKVGLAPVSKTCVWLYNYPWFVVKNCVQNDKNKIKGQRSAKHVGVSTSFNIINNIDSQRLIAIIINIVTIITTIIVIIIIVIISKKISLQKHQHHHRHCDYPQDDQFAKLTPRCETRWQNGKDLTWSGCSGF